MRVNELIELLQKEDQDTETVIYAGGYEHNHFYSLERWNGEVAIILKNTVQGEKWAKINDDRPGVYV